MATEGALSSTGYMLHHLTHNASGKMQSIIDFSVINYDTIFFSILMLVVSSRRKERHERCAGQVPVRRRNACGHGGRTE